MPHRSFGSPRSCLHLKWASGDSWARRLADFQSLTNAPPDASSRSFRAPISTACCEKSTRIRKMNPNFSIGDCINNLNNRPGWPPLTAPRPGGEPGQRRATKSLGRRVSGAPAAATARVREQRSPDLGHGGYDPAPFSKLPLAIWFRAAF